MAAEETNNEDMPNLREEGWIQQPLTQAPHGEISQKDFFGER